MINNNKHFDEINNSINPLYLKNRSNILELIKMINSGLGNSSQTYFLSIYYMDLIFTDKNFKKIYEDNENDIKIELKIRDLIIISLACLIISTKYNENDPNVPNIISFVNLCSYYSQNKYFFSVADLTKAEVTILKFLKYKLNYFTVYHYFNFFFAHGFLFQDIIENDNIKEKKYSKNEILEKIYILSREIMDKFIANFENINYLLGKNAFFSSIIILILSTEYLLNINLFKEKGKNVFELFYEFDYKENQQNNDIIRNKIQRIYESINLKEKELKTKTNNNQNNFISNKNRSNNYENFVSNTVYSKINIEPNLYYINNNLLISCDNYYLSKNRNSNNILNKIGVNENRKENYNFSDSKYNSFKKIKKPLSKSTNNYRYKQIFQFGNKNINKKNTINKYDYSSYKKTVFENKKEENVDKMKNIQNLIQNLQNKFISDNNISDKKDSYKSNNLYLKYKNDDNKTQMKDLLKSINNNKKYEAINLRNNLYKNYNNKLLHKKFNNKDNIVYKTKMILSKNHINNINAINISNINIEQKNPNFYYNKIYDNKKNYIINDRYSMKENIQDNYNNGLVNSMAFLQSKNLYLNNSNFNNSNFIKEKNSIEEKKDLYGYNKTEHYKNENNKINTNNSYGTFFQYDKLYQYENIDRYNIGFYKSSYFPHYLKNF